MCRRKVANALCALLFVPPLFFSGAARAAWTPMVSGTTYELRGGWGSSAADVFAVGIGGVILHYDGNPDETWSPMQNSSS
jgi:hypothetical protein